MWFMQFEHAREIWWTTKHARIINKAIELLSIINSVNAQGTLFLFVFRHWVNPSTFLNQVNNDIIFAWQSRVGHANECQLFLQKLVSECKYWSLNCNNYIRIAMLCFRQAPVLCNRGPTPNSPDSGHTPHSFIILHGISQCPTMLYC